MYWSEHLAGLHGRKKTLLRGAGLTAAAAQLAGLAMLGFSAVYREGFETVLFLQAIVLEAGVGPVAEGVALGLAGVAVIAVATIALQRKLPHRRMLELTGVLILAVLVMMVGKTVQVSQVVGWLPVHAVDGVRLPVLGGRVVRRLPDLGGHRRADRRGAPRGRELFRRGAPARAAAAAPARACRPSAAHTCARARARARRDARVKDAELGLRPARRREAPLPWGRADSDWNVNSIKQRVPRLLPWLDERGPDVVCLQETKLADDAFRDLLGEELADRGYAVAAHGEATWNGVAILSRVGLEDVEKGLAGAPGFPHPEARAVSATCDGIRVVSVYVPNGRVPGSEHYRYKLDWLGSLREMIAAGPEATIVCGDMNIAPTDDDVFDPDAYVGQTHVTAPERAALAELQALGLRDVVRDRWPNERVFTTGTTGQACSTRTWGCESIWCWPARPSPNAFRRHGWTGTPEGHRPERSRAGHRGPRRGAGRGHRPGRAAALEAGHEAGREEAAAGALGGANAALAPCERIASSRLLSRQAGCLAAELERPGG